MDIRVVTVSRGDITLRVDGKMMRILGEAMSIPEPEGFAAYAVYKHTMRWEDGNKVPKGDAEKVIEFLKADFLKRKLLLDVE